MDSGSAPERSPSQHAIKVIGANIKHRGLQRSKIREWDNAKRIDKRHARYPHVS